MQIKADATFGYEVTPIIASWASAEGEFHYQMLRYFFISCRANLYLSSAFPHLMIQLLFPSAAKSHERGQDIGIHWWPWQTDDSDGICTLRKSWQALTGKLLNYVSNFHQLQRKTIYWGCLLYWGNEPFELNSSVVTMPQPQKPPCFHD